MPRRPPIRLPLPHQYDGDLRRLADYIEDVEGAEILSIGIALELIKDLGDAPRVARQYSLDGSAARTPSATCAWRQSRTSTSARPIPFWAYPFKDISVVHNGQLTNYWSEAPRAGAQWTSLHVELRLRADRRLSWPTS